MRLITVDLMERRALTHEHTVTAGLTKRDNNVLAARLIKCIDLARITEQHAHKRQTTRTKLDHLSNTPREIEAARLSNDPVTAADLMRAS